MGIQKFKFYYNSIYVGSLKENRTYSYNKMFTIINLRYWTAQGPNEPKQLLAADLKDQTGNNILICLSWILDRGWSEILLHENILYFLHCGTFTLSYFTNKCSLLSPYSSVPGGWRVVVGIGTKASYLA